MVNEEDSLWNDFVTILLKFLRRHGGEKRITQEELSEKTKISQSRLSRIDRKEVAATIAEVDFICKAIAEKFGWSHDVILKSLTPTDLELAVEEIKQIPLTIQGVGMVKKYIKKHINEVLIDRKKIENTMEEIDSLRSKVEKQEKELEGLKKQSRKTISNKDLERIAQEVLKKTKMKSTK